jgi:hypothetical protein
MWACDIKFLFLSFLSSVPNKQIRAVIKQAVREEDKQAEAVCGGGPDRPVTIITHQ